MPLSDENRALFVREASNLHLARVRTRFTNIEDDTLERLLNACRLEERAKADGELQQMTDRWARAGHAASERSNQLKHALNKNVELQSNLAKAEARATQAEELVREVVGVLEDIADAPKLPKVHCWVGQDAAEDLFDMGLRHKSGLKPYDYLKTWLGMLRPFAYATQDDSWGEMEKLLCIVMRNYVRMIAKAEATAPLVAKLKAAPLQGDADALEDQPPFRLYDRVMRRGQFGDATGSVMAMQKFDHGWEVWVHVAAYGSNQIVKADDLRFIAHKPTEESGVLSLAPNSEIPSASGSEQQ